MTRILTFFLKPGGVLLVTDFTRTEAQLKTSAAAGSSTLIDEKYSHIVPHTNGMTEGDLHRAFDGAWLLCIQIIFHFDAPWRGRYALRCKGCQTSYVDSQEHRHSSYYIPS